ncbi:TIGR03619 family F420-dependent LLM class oxidoreductase [Promicromonospora sp. NPDC059942]|uniref:TIGR03619 family F420-dependent LLM class oxidoreductase n=1 Tax=Promicromonospora sp. NPDC059942 TaxID=3347009 RepID=UPI0036525DA6
MELQVVLPDESPAMPARTLVDLAQRAEGLGYTTAWLPDHVLPPGPYGATFGGVYEPLVTIGHLTAVTERLRFGTSVLVVPLRDPFVLAKQVATLHQLSGGRVVLGVGVGWNVPEFDAVGADHSRRGAVTDDSLALLRHLFAGGPAPYEGRRFSYEQGVFEPVPDGSVPIMVGGNSDAALRRAARYGDVWQGLPASPAAFAERVAVLAGMTGGGSAGSGSAGTGAGTGTGTGTAGGRAVAPALRIGWDGRTPVGQVADAVVAYREAGAAQLAVHFGEHEGTAQRMTALVEALATR